MAAPAKVLWWYERLADWLIQNPEKSLGTAAKEFKVTESWLSTIRSSEAFKEMWRQRSGGAAAALSGGLMAKTELTAEKALDAILTQIDKQGQFMDMKDLRETADMAMKNMGYGATASSPTVNVQVNTATVDKVLLERARDRMTKPIEIEQKVGAVATLEHTPSSASPPRTPRPGEGG